MVVEVVVHHDLKLLEHHHIGIHFLHDGGLSLRHVPNRTEIKTKGLRAGVSWAFVALKHAHSSLKRNLGQSQRGGQATPRIPHHGINTSMQQRFGAYRGGGTGSKNILRERTTVGTATTWVPGASRSKN